MKKLFAIMILMFPVIGIAETVSITVSAPSQQLTVEKQSTVITNDSVTVNAIVDQGSTDVVTVAVPGPQGIPGTGGTGDGGPVEWDDVLNKPTEFTPAPHSQAASSITGLSSVATTGSYTDLSNKPSIPVIDNYTGHQLRRDNPHQVTATQTGFTLDQFLAINGAAIPSESNPFATIHDILAAGYTSNYIFCEDDIFPATTPPWHELERQSDGGAVGLHSTTSATFAELDRYVTPALNTAVIPGGTWKFTMYVNLNAVQKEGTLKADIYRVDAAGATVTLLGTATSSAFINTVPTAIQMSTYISQQTGWNDTDRIGVVVSAKRGSEGGATVTWRHDAASGYASVMETPIVLLHNQLQGLNEGDYKHLTAAEKAAFANTTGHPVRTAGAHAATAISYSNPTYPTVAAALDQLLYVAPSITAHTNYVRYTNTTNCVSPCITSATGTTYLEPGNTITEVFLTWSLNKTVTTQSYDNSIGSINAAFRSYSAAHTFTASRNYTLTVGDGTSTDNSPATYIYLYNKRYWGVSSNTTLTDAQVIALSSEYSTDNPKGSVSSPISFSPVNQYIYYAYPDSWGGAATNMYLNGLQMTDWQLTTRSFVNASGNTTTFKIWRTTNLLNGTYTWYMN